MKSLPGDISAAIKDAKFAAGASRASLDDVAAKLGIAMPADYIAFMIESDGAEFSLGDSFVILLSVGDLSDENEPDDEFPAHLKVFGNNGGSEKYAFDTRTKPHPIVVVPHYQPDDDDVLPQGTSFVGFLRRIMKDELFGEE